MGARILDAAETLGELGAVFERFELRLRIRVVVGDVRPGVRLRDAQTCEQVSDRLAFHRRTAIGVDRELAGDDALLLAGLADQALREGCAFVTREHPAHHVAAEDVEDHVQVKVGPLGRTQELRDVPGPDLVCGRREQFGLRVVRMAKLVPPLADLAVFGEQAVKFFAAKNISLGLRKIQTSEND